MTLTTFLMILGGFLTATGAALLFHVPIRSALVCGCIGTLAGIVKLLTGSLWDSTIVSTFAATLLVALLSQFAARIEKKPVTVFLIPCIFPFVPGAGMYQIVFSLIESRSADATTYFFRTLEEAGAIALSVFIIDTLFKLRNTSHTKCT